MSEDPVFQVLQKIIADNEVVLFMKGTALSPQCGFSAMIVQILNTLGVSFTDINVLNDPKIRQGIKNFTNWPTIPQLYIKSKFVGGCDTVCEMHQSGELQVLLKELGVSHN